jgi:hypothetical protein
MKTSLASLVLVASVLSATPTGSEKWGDRDRTREIVNLWSVVHELQEREPSDDTAIAELTARLDEQRALIDQIASTSIRVQILDADTREIVAEKAYPWGTPIKLLLPRKQEDH